MDSGFHFGFWMPLAGFRIPQTKITWIPDYLTCGEFLDTKVHEGDRFNTLDVQTHNKQIETFQYTDFYSYHPPGVKKGFINTRRLKKA